MQVSYSNLWKKGGSRRRGSKTFLALSDFEAGLDYYMEVGGETRDFRFSSQNTQGTQLSITPVSEDLILFSDSVSTRCACGMHIYSRTLIRKKKNFFSEKRESQNGPFYILIPQKTAAAPLSSSVAPSSCVFSSHHYKKGERSGVRLSPLLKGTQTKHHTSLKWNSTPSLQKNNVCLPPT